MRNGAIFITTSAIVIRTHANHAAETLGDRDRLTRCFRQPETARN